MTTEDREYSDWKGDTGPGAALRESIQRDRESRMAKVKEEVVGIKIDQDVIDMIKSGTWEDIEYFGVGLKMPLTRDRQLYLKTNKVLTALGGKWNKTAQATIFEDEDAQTAVTEACRTGTYIDAKRLYQFFETPPEVSKIMLQHLKLSGKQTVLEPSAGNGALILAVASVCVDDDMDPHLTAVELNPAMQSRLEELTGEESQVLKRLIMADFLKLDPKEFKQFDRVIMNPPFCKSQDIKHVRHAYDFLSPGGILVAVMSPGFRYRSDHEATYFRQWLETGLNKTGLVQTQDFPENSFKVSGTSVRTVCLVVHKFA